MKMKKQVISLILLFGATAANQAFALDCKPLEPTPPTNQDVNLTGKINTEVAGIIGKITGVGAELDGAYRDLSKNILKEFPNADKLFIWSRLLYMRCEFISGSKQSDEEKNKQLEKLEDRFFDDPPEEVSLLPCRPNDTECYDSWISRSEQILAIRNKADNDFCNSIEKPTERSKCLFNARISHGNRITACQSSKDLIFALYDPQDCLKNGIIEGPSCEARKRDLLNSAESSLNSCDRDLAKRMLDKQFGG